MRVTLLAIVLCACAPKPAAPTELAPAYSMVVAMMHTCIADEQGVLRCSGANDQGELGDGTRVDRMEPVVVPTAAPVAFVTGEDPMCVLLTNGEVDCWGDPSWGALGDGTKQRRERPSKVLMLPPVVAIAGSGNRNCALDGAGATSCWGLDPELVDIRAERSVGLPEPIDVPPFVELGVGHSHACGRTKDGRVMCWGHNNWGQLGDGTTRDCATAVDVDVADAVQIAVGDFHACARLGDGTVRCWGRDMHRSCERMNVAEEHLVCPRAQPIAGIADAVQIVAGSEHACARTSDGKVSCWGSSPDGQLGGEAMSWPQPYASELPALAGATFIAAGPWRTCGRMPDDALRCVGRTFVGRDGGGTRTEIVD